MCEIEGARMTRTIFLSAALLLAAGAASARAEPGGCLKYGAAGAVGGHMVHHGVLGAVGGCAAGAYKRHEYRKQQRLEMRREQEQHREDNGSYQGGYQ
jgi:hypothetical protein